MLRDVVLHLSNEQPMLADLPYEPSPSDACLICTNLRTMSGKSPIFVERGDSTFVFPMQFVRFIEIKKAVDAEDEPEPPETPEPARVPAARRLKSGKPEARKARPPQPEAETADGDLGASLERLAWVSGNADSLPEPPAGAAATADPDADGDEFLRRVREI